MENILTITHVDTWGSHSCGSEDCTQCSRIYTDYAKDSQGKVYFSTSLSESTRQVGSKEGKGGWNLRDL